MPLMVLVFSENQADLLLTSALENFLGLEMLNVLHATV